MTNKLEIQNLKKEILETKNNLVNNTIKTKWDREISLNKLYKNIKRLHELQK
jgi:hypothetical protein